MTVVSILPVVRRATRGAALVLLVTGAMAACTMAARPGSPASRKPGGAPAQLGRAVDAAEGEAIRQRADDASRAQYAAQQLIRRGDMALEVDDVSRTARSIERLGTIMGGVIAQSSDDGKDDAHVSLRVPSHRLDETMDSVSRYGHVERRTTNSQDVTETLLDLDGRIASLAATRDRLRQLLAKSDAIRDVLEVERELGRVQAELESLERRVQGLRGQVAMSDLSVDIDRRVVLGPIGQLFRAIGVGIGKLFVWK